MKKSIVIFLIVVIIFGVFLRLFLLNSEFKGEETDFVKPAESIANNSRPIFYHSEQQPVEIALWHPPMYIYLMGEVFKFWKGEAAARSINLFFSLLTGLLIYFFCSKIIQKNGKEIGLISSAIFFINYYVLSSSIIIDIDVLSMFFVFSFFCCVIYYHKTKKDYLLFLGGISLIGSLANRYPMIIISYAFVFVYYLINPKFKKDVKPFLTIGVLGGAIFLILWGVYSFWMEVNFFSFLFHNFELGKNQISNFRIYALSFVLNISQIIRLFTLPFILIFLTGIKKIFSKREYYFQILWLYSLSIFVFFLVIPRPAFGYPRYFLTAIPGICILIGIFIYEETQRVKFKDNLFLVGLIIFILSFNTLILLNPQLTSYEGNGLIKATNFPDFLLNLLGTFPVFFVFLFKKDRKKVLIICLITLLLSYSLFFDFKLILHKTNIKEVAEYLKKNTLENDTIITPKAVGYYSERKFYINENTKPELNFSVEYLKKYLVKSWKNRNMDDEFFWSKGLYSGLYNPYPDEEELKQNISYVVLYHPVSGVEYEKKIGQFYVYKTKEIPS